MSDSNPSPSNIPPEDADEQPQSQPQPQPPPQFHTEFLTHSHVHDHRINQQQQQHQSPSSTAGRSTTRLSFSPPLSSNPTSRPRPRIHFGQNGQVRLDMGHGNVVTLPLQNGGVPNGNGPVNVRVLQIDPLMPQPVPDTMSSSNQHKHEDETWSKYKCAICYEFMNDPVGCGNCASRFCHSCLNRVAADAVSASNNNNRLPKCPTCRVEFRLMIRDDALKNEMIHGPTVPCRFEGCSEQLKLHSVLDHEKQCEHALMKCRYVTFGCKWTGKRGQLSHHEQNDCHLARVSNLIEEFRKLKGDHSTRLDIVQRQVMGSMQMNNVHRQSLQRDQLKSTANIWDLLLYCHVLTCSTPLFFFTKDKWVTLFRPIEGRAAVINFLVFLPTMIICAVTASSGFGDLLRLLDSHHQQTTTTTPTIAVEDAWICICIGILGVLLMVANFVDGKSSQSWRKFAFRYMGTPSIMCDIVAISSFTIHLSVMEYHGAGFKAFLLWLPLAMCTTFFPALVATLSHTAARNMTSTPAPTATSMCSSARSLEPFLFGLRYSVLATFVGVLPCLDASILIVLLSKPLKNSISPSLVMPNCFLEAFPKSFTLAYFGAKAALLTVEFQNDNTTSSSNISEAFWWIADSILAVGILIVLNFVLHQMFALGIALGQKIATQAQADVRPEGVQKDYNLTGMVCFGGWVCMLGTMTQFR